ncbi:MAG: ATP-binding protein, partial [Nitrospirota bacterium]
DHALLISSLIALFTIWGSITLASNITRPLTRLASAANAVAIGKLSQIKYADAKDEEIITLVDAFNKMTENLSNMLISRDYVENIFHAISDAITIINEDGVITTVNSAALNLLEYQKEELIGRNAGTLFGETTGEGDIKKIRYQLTRKLGFDNMVAEYITKSGNRVPVIISGSLLTSRDGTGYNLVIVAKDITDRKQQEEELQSMLVKLEQSNRELQDFAHIASHDLQEPLRKIMAFGDRLNSKYMNELDDQGRDYLKRMRNAAVRMQYLIQSLLLYSRVTTKAQPFEQVDLSEVKQEVLSDLEFRIVETGGRIVETDKLPVVNADPLQMRQLFQNLISNALKFSKKDEKPLIKISCRSVSINGNGKMGHEITVEDNGIGFDEQYADRIFGVFQRLHGRSEFEGSGIGLSICRKIVTRHGGHISAKSTPGHGARFIITLPHPEQKDLPAQETGTESDDQ